MEALTTAEAAAVTYRVLDYWCRAGVVQPAAVTSVLHGRKRATPGSGTRRRWTAEQLPVLACLGELSNLGANTPVLTAVAAQLQTLADWPAEVWVHPTGQLLFAPPAAGWYLATGQLRQVVLGRAT